MRTVFVSPTGPETEPVPNKAFLLEWLFFLFTDLSARDLLPFRKARASGH